MSYIKKILCAIFLLVILTIIRDNEIIVCAEEVQESNAVELQSKSAVLMETTTGDIIYEKEKDVKLNPASITKIMTLILIYEEIEKGTFDYDDIVTVSAHAASMGGSQVFLEENETQTVKDMIKCITIASANDACVAMAEYIAESETEFVSKMNEKAKSLGMNNTNFVNCCGLDVEGHYSSAYDVALMSRELLTKHPKIKEFTTTWMDKIIHKTAKGESEFGLTNTNKLVRTYNGISGLKTGSTSLAKYCLSASANRNNIELVAVVMSAPEHKLRYTEAAKLLDYGFAHTTLYKSAICDDDLKKVNISSGTKKDANTTINNQFSYVITNKSDKDEITYKINYYKNIKAPLKKGNKVGDIVFRYGNKEIGSIDIVAEESIRKAKLSDYISRIFDKLFILY